MDPSLILVALGAIVLMAYLLDFVGRRLRVPAVVLLIFSGLALSALDDFTGVKLDLPHELLPVLGTVGLILIVLEGALDISLTREHIGLVGRTALVALLGILCTGGLIAVFLMAVFKLPTFQSMLLAAPLAIISSAVAIPAASALAPNQRVFVVYESSLSDILGVIIFYALLSYNGNVGELLVSQIGEVTLSVVVGLLMALAVFWLMPRIDHHVRVLPLIFGIVLLYGVGKMMHLAPLVMVLLVGLLLNNGFLIERLTRGRMKAAASFATDLEGFKHLTAEFTFVVRSFFFVLLGFSTKLANLANPMAWGIAAVIMVCCILPRLPLLRWVAGERSRALVFFAPRGLITVLLFMSLPEEYRLPDAPPATVMLVILMWAMLLTYGSVRFNDSSRKEAAPAGSPPTLP
ncbi:cation:proton antiporter [Uliginosibacterium sp. H3]|uniref:Cation:proton antiporter n=1 Tax=Uliginosibacterium silvisoli TaxID=3114758 RepID=A0ABU6K349_9RHOO|nr:cation:proton antiporter [Uliginosibacterium sp. H3]